MSNVGIKRPCECTIAHDISLENVSRMHELSEAFHAISLRHTCLMSILEQFSKLSSRAGKHNGMLLLIMLLLLFMLLIQLLWRNMEVVVEKVLMHDFIIRYNVMAPTLGLVSYLPILETYFINNLARVRSLQLELKSRIEEFEKLDKFHMEQMEEEVTVRNAHIHQQKVGSLECFMVAKSSVGEFSKTDIVEAWTH
ncbi:uncharacterized protein LOC104878154 isoform X2 [Vitis vinifera]|uniref:uncharacterized protein LOC104878154 isoform X2 n=1 Tax=Vitis vinifera TaxID=29760 RepID=UPI002883410B|nr:uncharacterized protein LOC104878154 isoform X2 [Vitis vinifera]XP_059593535.1 uncharacterized protein LOC104878154 isoform X2 [Vitis vinifera]